MTGLTCNDEGVHPWGAEENWQESAVITWRDADLNIGGNHRIGIWPNRNNCNLWCGVYKDYNKVFRLNLEEQPLHYMQAPHHGLQCGPQRIYHDGQHLRLSLDTPQCKAELIVTDYAVSLEKFDDEKSGGISAQTYRAHFNLHNEVRGDVELNGQLYRIDNARGWRDHSYGPRDYNGKLCHRSFHGNFGEKLNFHLLTVLGTDGQLDRRGFLVRDGHAISLSTFTTRMEMLEDGITPVRATCLVLLPDGEELIFTCKVHKGIQARVFNMRGFFGVGDCYYKGERGFCNVEIQNNPRFGSRDLTLALGNTLENGYFDIDMEPWMYEPLALG